MQKKNGMKRLEIENKASITDQIQRYLERNSESRFIHRLQVIQLFAGAEKQNIKFGVYSRAGGSVVLSYQLRAATPGEYIVESAAARDSYGGYGLSPRGKATISE